MVKTRAEVKVKIGEWIEKQTDSFTTQDVREEIKPIATNIHLSPNRLTNYIRSTGKADFDKKEGEWIPKITPKIKIKED